MDSKGEPSEFTRRCTRRSDRCFARTSSGTRTTDAARRSETEREDPHTKFIYLITGLPGHPLHPPLTDATIGVYTGATAFALLSVLGVAEQNTAVAWWLALVVGLVLTVFTAVTGLVDWLGMESGSPMRRTATLHLVTMVVASIVFLFATLLGRDDYLAMEVTGGSLALTLIAFGLLTLGGWLGGTIVFVHGMRVLDRPHEPTGRAISPLPSKEEELADPGTR